MDKETKIFWNKQLVGKIKDVEIDNFFIYGFWKPIQSQVLEEFLQEIDLKGSAIVQIGNNETMLGIVEEIPQEEIEIKTYLE